MKCRFFRKSFIRRLSLLCTKQPALPWRVCASLPRRATVCSNTASVATSGRLGALVYRLPAGPGWGWHTCRVTRSHSTQERPRGLPWNCFCYWRPQFTLALGFRFCERAMILQQQKPLKLEFLQRERSGVNHPYAQRLMWSAVSL